MASVIYKWLALRKWQRVHLGGSHQNCLMFNVIHQYFDHYHYFQQNIHVCYPPIYSTTQCLKLYMIPDSEQDMCYILPWAKSDSPYQVGLLRLLGQFCWENPWFCLSLPDYYRKIVLWKTCYQKNQKKSSLWQKLLLGTLYKGCFYCW